MNSLWVSKMTLLHHLMGTTGLWHKTTPWHPSLKCTWDPTSCNIDPPPKWQQQSPSLLGIRHFEPKFLSQTVSKAADFHKCFLYTVHLWIPISKTVFSKIKILLRVGIEPAIGMASASQSSALALWSKCLPWNLKVFGSEVFRRFRFAKKKLLFELTFCY